MFLVRLPPPFSVLYLWKCLCINVHMLQMWSSVYCNMDLGTLERCTLVCGRLIYHFCMGTRLNKLSCIVPRILSLILWIYCKVWGDIHISISCWFSKWISRCPQCAYSRRMFADGLVLKNSEGVQLRCRHGNRLLWNLYLYIWSSLTLTPIWFRIFLCCCMLGLTWNISCLILCVVNGSHWQRKIHGRLKILVVFGHEKGKGYPWDGLVVIWDPCDCLALYDGYLEAIYGFCSDDDVCGNWTVKILLFCTASLKVCVDVHPTSCCGIIVLYAPLIYRLWNNDLLLSQVLRKVYYVVWYLVKAYLVV